ncbi:MAG: hypothetical protein ACJAY8_000911, partial [Sphingobacteriales bacterium]
FLSGFLPFNEGKTIREELKKKAKKTISFFPDPAQDEIQFSGREQPITNGAVCDQNG